MTFTTLISPAALAQHQNPEWRIFDCRHALSDPERGRRAYLEAHLPNAVFAHLDEDLSGPIVPGKTGRHPLPDPAEFRARLGAWGVDNQSQVIAYDDVGGAIAARLWWMLRWLGHDSVAVLDGGWQAWCESGPTTAVIPNHQPTTYVGERRPEMARNASQLKRDMVRGGIVADAREARRYQGKTEPIDAVAGHIPGAINLPYADNLGPDGRFRDLDQLKARFRDLAEREPIFYCGSGVTAAHNILAMTHAGFAGARLYPGSWSEWIVDPDRGVALC